MQQLTLSNLGPLTDAVSAFAPPAFGAPFAERFLADLIDLPGSVALAERLAAPAEVSPGETLLPEEARERLAWGLADVDRRLADAFENAFKRRYRLPDAGRAWAVCAQAGALENPTAAAVRRAARTLWAPFGEFLETQRKRARLGLRELRAEMAALLPRLGPEAARLEGLDAALDTATASRAAALHHRVPHALERGFAVELRAALRALPSATCGETGRRAAFDGGFAEGGWLGRYFGRARGLTMGLILHERQRLEALVETACALGEAAPTP